MNGKYKPFSERSGYTEPKLPQLEWMDSDLRTGLWNVFYEVTVRSTTWTERICRAIFTNFLKKPSDEYGYHRCLKGIKSVFLNEKWHKVYDLIEFAVRLHPSIYVSRCNSVLERENSAYRIVGNRVVEITSEQEVAEIEAALKIPFDSARGHLEKALARLSDRENPDYENSIKESISAVESVAKEVTGDSKATLGELVDSIDLHPAFRGGLKKLYGFTSDAGGIRHADDSSKPGKYLKPDQTTARFMLVTCSAFVNYIIAGSPE